VNFGWRKINKVDNKVNRHIPYTGNIITTNVLTNEELQPVIDKISVLIDHQARKSKMIGKLRTLHENEPFEKSFGLIFEQSSEIGRGLEIIHYRDPIIFEFLHTENPLDAVESLEITCNPITTSSSYYANQI